MTGQDECMGKADGEPNSTERVRWLDVEQQHAWRAYLVGTTLLMDRLDRDLRSTHGIALTEYEILVRLSEAPDRRMRMALLAHALCHSRSRVTHTVSRMERAGLVERDPCLEDGRGVEAVLTEKGYATLVAAAPDHVTGVREYLVELASDDDLAAVGHVFDAVADRLTDQENAPVGDIRR
jgi:DNA-binding MarR family transcriptional regulator